MIRHVVIIGNGVAGFSAARRLRREDNDLTISIFSDEAHPFYLRRQLKDFIAGALGEHEMILESRNLYRRERLSLFLQSPVVGLDVANQEVVLASRERVHYDGLLLATGCAPEPLPVPGGGLKGVFSLRTLAEAQTIRRWMQRHDKAVVLGEGLVSLQLAESLARTGAKVDYMLLGEHFWPDVFDPATSGVVAELLAGAGVRIHPRVKVVRILGRRGAVAAVELEGGTVIPCDTVGHGCSFRPSTDLLADTPVACADGVVVNDRLETSVAGVFAAGSIADFSNRNHISGRSLRQWSNAFRLGETAAVNLLGHGVSLEEMSASVKTELCGVGVAVIGRASLADVESSIQVEQSRRGAVYRRLVFQDDILVGVTLVGDTAHASMLEQHVIDGSMRADLGEGLLLALMEGEPQLTAPMETACPICTDGLHLPAGALIGSEFACNSCRSLLKLTYSGDRPAVIPAGK